MATARNKSALQAALRRAAFDVQGKPSIAKEYAGGPGQADWLFPRHFQIFVENGFRLFGVSLVRDQTSEACLIRKHLQ